MYGFGDNPNAPFQARYGASGEIMIGLLASGYFATLTAAKGYSGLIDGMTYTIAADGSQWRFSSASTLTGDDKLVATVASGGRLLRLGGADLSLAFTFATADGATLYTVPTGFVVAVVSSFWEVTTGFTGGSSSAIGLASSNANLSTAGDILGGASGDVAATLVSTGAYGKGTKGTKVGAAVIIGGETITFERITSAFTAGAGNAHVVVQILATPAS